MKITRKTGGLFFAIIIAAGFLAAIPGLFGADSMSAAAAPDCDRYVNPGAENPLQTAINNAASGETICVSGGTYHETVRVPVGKTGLTLIAAPGQSPIIDGQKVLPGGMPVDRFRALVELNGSGTTFDGFEVRYSSAGGIDITVSNVTVRNNSVHDNWSTGINARGSSQISGILIENNQVFNNIRRAQYMPVIYRGLRGTDNGATDWTFDPSVNWDMPFWTGVNADLPEQWLNDIAMTFNDDGATSRVYVGSPRAGRVGNIGAEYSSTGQQFSYSGADILFHEPATNKWTLYFDGEPNGIPQNSVIDAFQIESTAPISESWPCDTCVPMLLSFTATVSIPITEGVLTPTITQTVIGPSDLVYFWPTAMDATRIINGYYTLHKRAADLVGLPEGANIDALDRAPDGRLLISLNANGVLTNPDESIVNAKRENLVAFDESTGYWSLFFDGDQIPYNPFQAEDLTAAWVDGNGDIYISGNPVGGSALTLINTIDSTARGNAIYNNYGEGLVSGRFSVRATLEDNISYDNLHANLYLNSTVDPLVRRNLVYCTDDRRFWRKGSAITYHPSPGIQIRDEVFSADTPVSSGQVIVNNIVVGCSSNFNVSTQRPNEGYGLNNALVANNTFANARGDTAEGINNIEVSSSASYANSRFVNNLILQSTPGAILRVQGAGADLSTFTVANNLYSVAPPATWFPGEAGRVVGNPLLNNPTPPLPVMGSSPDPEDYRLTYASPALDAGWALAELTDDFFATPRTGNGAPDIGAHELPHIGRIIVTQATIPAGSPQRFDFSADFSPAAFSLGDGEQHDSGVLEAGTYALSVAPVEGWTTTAACSDSSPIESILLGPNETVICAFISVRKAQITLNHVVDPTGDTTLFDFTLSPGETFQMGSESRAFVIEPGAYSLTAAVPPGWQQEAACGNGDAPGALALDAGESVTCTFTHRRLGRIIVSVLTNPPNTSGTFDFITSYAPGGFGLSHGQSHESEFLTPYAQYSVVETLPAGWVQLSAVCDDGSLPGAIDLAAGEVVACTFTNARLSLGLVVEPTPGAVTTPGGDVEFAVRVLNDGDVPVGAISLIDSIYGDVTDVNNPALVDTNCELPQSLAAGEDYTCAFMAYIAGAGGTVHNSTLTASGMGSNSTPVSTVAETAVTINIPPPGRIIVTKQTDPPDASGVFQFTASYGNFSLSNGQSHDSGLLPSGAIYSVVEMPLAGWAISSAICTGDDDGTDPATIMLDPGEVVLCIFINSRTTPGPLATFYLTTPKKGSVQGVAYSPGDILAYDNATTTWSIYFDASDVGVTKALDDFVLMNDGSILMTFKSRMKLLNGSGTQITIEPQDIARFVPSQLDDVTAGWFEQYFDGSDVGLTTSGEKIDALAIRPDGTLLISPSGAATVKSGSVNVKAQDEDLLAFTLTSSGATTSGTWHTTLALDGSTLAGMAVENVTAAWADPDSQTIYLAVTSNFTIKGIKGTNRTILSVSLAGDVATYWDLSATGFNGQVDGLHIVR